MKRSALTVVSLFMFVLFPTLLLAATHYVTPAGAGSRNGSDWSNAYQGLPGSLTRGDTYVIAGGSYPGKNFSDSESGTAVIYIRKASSLSSFGDNAVAGWSSGFETNQAVFAGQTTFSRGYYIVDGVTPSTGHWQTSGYGIKFTYADPNQTNHLVMAGYADVSNITIKHAEFANAGNAYDQEQIAIFAYSANYGDPGSYIYNDWLISHCYFHDSIVFMKMQINSPRGWIVEHSYFANNGSTASHHGEQMSFLGTGSSSASTTPIQIRYNWFEPYGGTGSLIYLTYLNRTANDVKIYGNVWHNPGTVSSGNGVIGTGDSGGSSLHYDNWKIYNNTFIGGTAHLAIGFNSPPPTGWEIRNNLFYNCTADLSFNPPTGAAISNNYRNNSPFTWGSCTNCITSTEAVSTLFPNYSNRDYHLGQNSQAVNAGASLVSPYNFDADTLSRPQGSAFDMGAFEYKGSGTTTEQPMAPTNLRVN